MGKAKRVRILTNAFRNATCVVCQTKIPVGEQVWYDRLAPNGRKVWHQACNDRRALPPKPQQPGPGIVVEQKQMLQSYCPGCGEAVERGSHVWFEPHPGTGHVWHLRCVFGRELSEKEIRRMTHD